jgi:hypothetical protein
MKRMLMLDPAKNRRRRRKEIGVQRDGRTMLEKPKIGRRKAT